MRSVRKSILLSATALFAVISLPVVADDKVPGEIVIAQAGSPPPAGASSSRVERVTVTATRRKTALQKTPVAVTAVGEKAVEDAKIENIEDLMAVVPSLQITNGGNPTAYTARIRGVGTQGNNAGLEAAVGTFIDGVYRSRASVAFGDLGEIERIEVLRGPQGTLFGRNTSAGILHVITKRPSFEHEYESEVTAGSFDQFVGKASVNVPASDTMAFRLFAVRQEQEGFIDVNPGRPDFYDGNAKSYYSVRGQMFWQMNPNLDFRLIADYSEREDQCCSAATIFPGGNGRALGAIAPFNTSTSAPTVINFLEAPFPGKATSSQVENQIAFGDRSTDSEVEDRGISGEFNWNMGRSSFTSITSFRQWETAYGQDADFSGADIVYFDDDGQNTTKYDTFTHEMRVNGEASWVDWLFGLYYSNEDIERHSTLKSGFDQEAFVSLHRFGDSATTHRTNLAFFSHPGGTPVYQGGFGGDDLYKQSAQSFALFTHNVIHLGDTLDLTLGLRYTAEEKEFDATYRTDGQHGCTSVETQLGLNPAAGAGAQALNVAFACLPGSRHALDRLTDTFGGHHQEREENEWSGIATLAWEVQENFNSYLTYSRGHKAGGFNLDRSFADAGGSIVIGAGPNTVVAGVLTPTGAGPQSVRAPNTSFPPEFVDAYELGLKSSFKDGRLIVNTAVFYQDFENFQLNTFTGVSFIVTSVPEVISQGVEVESFWRIRDNLSANLAVQYTDAHYGDIGCITCPGTFLAANAGLFLLKDATITHSPEWTVAGGVDFDHPVFGDMLATFHMDGRWQSEMNTGSNLDPRKVQEAFAVFGAKIGLYTHDEWLGFEIFARNVFDERYINTAFDSPLHGSSVAPGAPSAFNGSSTIDTFLGEPRMIGGTIRIRH